MINDDFTLIRRSILFFFFEKKLLSVDNFGLWFEMNIYGAS